MSPFRTLAASALALVCAAVDGVAQAPSTGLAATAIGPTVSIWNFANAVRSDSFDVRGARHVAIPVSARFAFGRLTIDAGGAYASSSMQLDDGRTFSLTGMTDVRVRGVAQLAEDRLLLTVGLNLPTGASELSGYQVDALSVLAGSALGFAPLALGNGFGATAGLVYAFRRGEWGVAVGSSFEARRQFTPIEARLAGGSAPADFHPGSTQRFSLALDRLVGQGRMSFLFAGDFHGESRLQLRPENAALFESHYTPGPQFSTAALFDLGVSGFRSFRITMTDRVRSAFTGADGQRAPGSSGNVFEAAVEGVRGRARGAGVYFRADARFDSGLEVDNTIATAAMSALGMSLGVSVVNESMSVLPVARFQAGRLDAGTTATTATGFGAGLTIVIRP